MPITSWKPILATGILALSTAAMAQSVPDPDAPSPEPRHESRYEPALKSTLRYRAMPEGAAPETLDRVKWKYAQAGRGTILGVAASKASPAMVHQLRLDPDSGIVVENVISGSAAQKAGIRQYDVIVKLDDELLTSPEQFAAAVRTHKPGEEITLEVIREGRRRHVNVTLLEQPKRLPPGFAPEGHDFNFTPGPQPKGKSSKPEFFFAPGEKMFKAPFSVSTERDQDGNRVLIIRTPEGKIIEKQTLPDEKKLKETLQGELRELDQLKEKIREQAEQFKEKTLSDLKKQKQDRDEEREEN